MSQYSSRTCGGSSSVGTSRASRTPAAARIAASIGIALVLCGNASMVHGEGKLNRDYYNPGTGTDERADWQNAHQFHLGPAFDAMKRGNWGPARDNLEFILRVFPNSPLALNGISELCVLKWRSPKCDADSWMEKAVAVNPSIATTWIIYGIHLQREKRPAEAVEKFKRGLELRPDDINGHYNLGLAYFDLKDYDNANKQAQMSYALGAPLPGLRDMLKRVGAWKPPAAEKSDATSPAATNAPRQKVN